MLPILYSKNSPGAPKLRRNKSVIAIGTAAVLLLSQACGGDAVSEKENQSITETSDQVVADTIPESDQVAEPTSDESDWIEVDEGVFSTEVRIPLNAFGEGITTDVSAGEMSQELIAEGYDVEVQVESNVAILKMSPTTYELMKADFKRGVDDFIAQSLDEEGDVFKSVDYSGDMKEFQVKVDSVAFGQSMSFFGFGLVLAAAMYQPFAGVDTDDSYVKINYVDSLSGETLQTYDTRDL